MLMETCLYRFCLLICMCSTSYMTYLQFKYYLNNEDMASISYRIFNNEEQDEYPTFSICFGGDIFNESHDFFNPNNVTQGSYQEYLEGYEKDYPAEFTTVEFNDVVLDIHEGYLMKFEGALVPWYVVPLDLIPTYRSPKELCISKNIVHRKNVMQWYDYVMLNSSMLYEDNREVTVHVHKKGQLIRSMATYGVSTRIRQKTLKNGVKKTIEIGQVDILRKRADGKIPCDQYMQDEDKYRIEQIIKSVGCIPTFWMHLGGSIGLIQSTPMCKTAMDYNKVYTQLYTIWENPHLIDIAHKLHCTTMVTSVTITDETANNVPGILKLTMLYHGTSYRETINTKAYSSETLLGQIGGFVGKQ